MQLGTTFAYFHSKLKLIFSAPMTLNFFFLKKEDFVYDFSDRITYVLIHRIIKVNRVYLPWGQMRRMKISDNKLQFTLQNNMKPQISTYTLSRRLLLISCVKKNQNNFTIVSKILWNSFWMWKSDVVTTCRNHNVETAIFLFFHIFALMKGLLFLSKPWLQSYA